MRLLLVLPVLFFSHFALADVCSKVIDDASLEGYEGEYGGYDEDGYCHARDLTEDECREKTGDLFASFSPDHRKNFTLCRFNPPSDDGGSMGREVPDDGGPKSHDEDPDVQLKARYCTNAQNAFIEEVRRLPENPDRTTIEFRLKADVNEVEHWCPLAGMRNSVTNVLGTYNDLLSSADGYHATPSRPAPENATFSFTVCNSYSFAVVAALVARNQDNSYSVMGWYGVEAGKCRNIGNFRKGDFYYYAESQGVNPVRAFVNGTHLTKFCTQGPRFTWPSNQSCPASQMHDFSFSDMSGSNSNSLTWNL